MNLRKIKAPNAKLKGGRSHPEPPISYLSLSPTSSIAIGQISHPNHSQQRRAECNGSQPTASAPLKSRNLPAVESTNLCLFAANWAAQSPLQSSFSGFSRRRPRTRTVAKKLNRTIFYDASRPFALSSSASGRAAKMRVYRPATSGGRSTSALFAIKQPRRHQKPQQQKRVRVKLQTHRRYGQFS